MEKKEEILKYIEKHKEQSQGQIGLQFGSSQSTIATIIKNKDSTVALLASGRTDVKNRSSKCANLERGLDKFYDACKAKQVTAVTYDMLITKERLIAQELIARNMAVESDIPASDKAWKSYLQRFLAKHSIKSQLTHGKSVDADTTAADTFMKNEWPGIFLRVDRDPSRVWNMDETGLFWCALPKLTLANLDLDSDEPCCVVLSDDVEAIVGMLQEELQDNCQDEEEEEAVYCCTVLF